MQRQNVFKVNQEIRQRMREEMLRMTPRPNLTVWMGKTMSFTSGT